MWKKTLLLNTVLMCVFGIASYVASQGLVEPALQGIKDSYGEIPFIKVSAAQLRFVTLLIPGVWIVGYPTILFNFHHRIKNKQDFVQLHTSITLLIGVSMLVFFTIADRTLHQSTIWFTW